MDKRQAQLIINSWNKGGYVLDYKSKVNIGLFGKDRFAVPKGDVVKLLTAMLVLSKPVEEVQELVEKMFAIYQVRSMTPNEFKDHLEKEMEKLYNGTNILDTTQNGKA